MWEKVTTIILITTYTFCVLFLFCILLEKLLTSIIILNIKSSKSSPSLFEIPNIKNAKVIKTEVKPFLQNIVYNIVYLHLKMNPTALKYFLLLENIWIHISSKLDIDLQLFLQKILLFKSRSLTKKLLQPKYIEEQLTQLISKSISKTFFMLF